MERKRWLKGIGLLMGLALLFALVVFVVSPPCVILKLTGFYCPGCGGQRMIFSFLRGDLSAAFHHNPLLFFLLPCAVVYSAVEVWRYGKGKRLLLYSKRFLWVLLCLTVLALVFAVLRNLHGFSFLGP